MARVIDSSAWIEWLSKTATGVHMNAQIPQISECIVPTIVQLEVFKWLERERNTSEAQGFLAYTTFGQVFVLDTNVAKEAARLSAEFKLSTADAIIYATARLSDSDLLTCDRHFEHLPHVTYVQKSGAER
ncbi:type II toxin-antitoxin system VapC family toxin [Neorhizobium sp. BETTINA12A]|uniref:type II toxin-antitoxin system VapC family toxin n=1 Tax=Neorhizobium sp. BETTINA12A TaxID=2908924 RepID=UPI001FF69DD3|nr:type II toxin-antitoxin system VapC family toxin [Neorhizobium sp. BETTINA12A]MCJ9749833.1 type II toxin-antitoxin system VapC family toxin [Neorhizobium sp. BETTINA12A]